MVERTPEKEKGQVDDQGRCGTVHSVSAQVKLRGKLALRIFGEKLLLIVLISVKDLRVKRDRKRFVDPLDYGT